MEILVSICLGIGLSAAAGFRIFIPLLALSAATYFEAVPVQESWQWVGSIPAMLTLGIAALVEVGAYFIPYVDNALDSIAVPLATIAGTLMTVSVLTDLSPVITWALGIIAGGGTAAAISTATGGTRLASTISTAGLGNPLINIVETGASLLMSVLSIFAMILAAILAIGLLIGSWSIFQKLKPKS